MAEGTQWTSEAIESMNELLSRVGKQDMTFGTNFDGWEFSIVNKYDKPIVVGKISPDDNIVDIALTEIHFDQEVVKQSVSSDDASHHLERMEIPPGGTAKVKGGKHAWLTGWPAGCAFWFKEPDDAASDSYCSIAIETSTSILEVGAVTRSTTSGLGSSLEAVFPPQQIDETQFVYLQRR
jgi:hypothetical protein